MTDTTTPETNNLLMLIDGQPLIWRSIQQYDGLKTRSGEDRGVVYGAINALIRAVDAVKPAEIIIAWDSGHSRFRKDLFPGYKASRNTDERKLEWEKILPQVDVVKNLIRSMGIKQVSVRGVEADDLLGVLSSGYAEQGKQVVLCSSDKDFHQLLRPLVWIYDPIKRAWMTREHVETVHEVKPHQLLDYMALSGAGGDDIPKVAGIGPKKAVELLWKHPSLEAFLASPLPSKSAPKWVVAAHQGREMLRLARRLVEIATVSWLEPLAPNELHQLEEEMVSVVAPDRMTFASLCGRWGLEGMVPRMDAVFGKPAPEYRGFPPWLPLSPSR